MRVAYVMRGIGGRGRGVAPQSEVGALLEEGEAALALPVLARHADFEHIGVCLQQRRVSAGRQVVLNPSNNETNAQAQQPGIRRGVVGVLLPAVDPARDRGRRDHGPAARHPGAAGAEDPQDAGEVDAHQLRAVGDRPPAHMGV